jgi:tetratricopeptide (TPR) repeat protein
MTILLLALLAAGEGCPPLADEAAREEGYRSYVAGQVQANEGRFDEALVTLRAAVRGDPLLPQAQYALGQALMGLRRFPEAVDAFQACRDAFRCRAALDPSERAQIQRRAEAEIRELRDAIRGLDRDDLVTSSLPVKELNLQPQRSRGETMRLVAQMEERVAELEAWRRRGFDPRPPAVVSLALGTAYFQAGSLPDAERELKAALADDPGNGDAHHNLAVVYLATDRIPEAEREVKAAQKAGIEVNPRLRQAIKERKAH